MEADSGNASRRGFLRAAAIGTAAGAIAAAARGSDALADTVSTLPLVVESPNGGYSGTLQEWQDSSGAPMSWIAASGDLHRRADAPGSSHVSYGWTVAGSTFNGTFDPSSYFGYNVPSIDPSGTVNPPVAGEPYGAYVLEADYNDGSKRTMELYTELRSSDGVTTIRPWFFQVKRDATSPSSFLTSMYINGNPFNVVHPDGSTIAKIFKNSATFYAPSAAHNNLYIQSAVGQAASLSLGANGTQDVFRINSDSSSLTRASFDLNNQRVVRLYAAPKGVAGSSLAVGADDSSAVGVFDVGSSYPALKGLVVRGASGQSGNLQEWQSSQRSSVLAVGPTGTLQLGGDASANLYRSAAATVKTDGLLIAKGGLGVGNSSAASSPGRVVRKIQVFDASGASLGYAPVYDNIA